MLGAFARKLTSRDRVLSYEETGEHKYAMRTHNEGGVHHAETHDAPPEGFVERIPHEGGDVFIAPMLEALRNVLRTGRAKRAEDEKPEAPLLPQVHENP